MSMEEAKLPIFAPDTTAFAEPEDIPGSRPPNVCQHGWAKIICPTCTPIRKRNRKKK